MIFTIATDYSQVTGLRHCNVSEGSGEDFYHSKLNEVFTKAYQEKEKLTLVLDGVLGGYTPSFLDEAIGNLVYDFGLDVVKTHLDVISDRDRQWIFLIEERTYPNWEERRKNGNEPTITQVHPAWYRLTKKGLEKKVWVQM